MNPASDKTSSSHSGNAVDPLFTVLIPTYDRPRLLAEAIESVLAQTLTSWELIVIDDASPTPPDVPGDPRVRLLRQVRNSGKAAALNAGLDVSRGEYIAFLDDDDMWTRHRLANALSAHKAAPIVACRSASTSSGFPSMPESHTTSETRETRISRLPNMGAISVRRDLCPRLDPDYRASQDLEWKIRLLQDGPTVSFVESADFIYRHHSGARNLNGAQERVIAQRRLIEQHEEYFVHHKDEHAFRLYRTGLVHYRMGQRSSAALAAIESMRIRPNTNAAELMARVILPPSWTLAAIKRASPRRARGINE